MHNLVKRANNTLMGREMCSMTKMKFHAVSALGFHGQLQDPSKRFAVSIALAPSNNVRGAEEASFMEVF